MNKQDEDKLDAEVSRVFWLFLVIVAGIGAIAGVWYAGSFMLGGLACYALCELCISDYD